MARHRERLPGILAMGLVVAWLGCDPVDTCDRDQYYGWGTCADCPEDSDSTGDSCRCHDPAKRFDGVDCTYMDGAAPEPDAASGDDDAGTAPPGAACGDYCDFMRVCLADNGLVASVAADVILAVGIDGSDTSACVAGCTPDADDAANAMALDCFAQASASASCAGDQTLTGAEEALGIIDACCAEHRTSATCGRLCDDIALNALALSMVPACQ